VMLVANESGEVNAVLCTYIADSALTSSTDQDAPPLNLFAVHTSTKVERSSEKVRSVVPMERISQSKSRSLDTAARQTRLPLDGKQLATTDAETHSHGVSAAASAASGQADRHRLKQLAINRVS